MNCVNWNLRLCLTSGVEVQCMPVQNKVCYGVNAKGNNSILPKKTSLTTCIFLQRVMKSGKDLKKMLPTSPSLASATQRLK